MTAVALWILFVPAALAAIDSKTRVNYSGVPAALSHSFYLSISDKGRETLLHSGPRSRWIGKIDSSEIAVNMSVLFVSFYLDKILKGWIYSLQLNKSLGF